MKTFNGALGRAVVTAVAVAAFAASAGAVDYAARSIPAKIEVWPIPSQTVTLQQFLTGEPGTAVTIGAELRIPQTNDPDCPACIIGITERFPAVVLLHGGGGVISTQDTWAGEFLERGFAVMIVDSSTGRGGGGGGNQSAALDTFGALGILANHPRIDPTRIIVLGYSAGANAALFTALDRFDALWNTSGAAFAGYMMVTPNCGTSYIDDTAFADVPIRIFVGLADEANPIEQCQGYVDRILAAGPADIELTAYPDARHAFGDRLNFAVPITMPAGNSAHNCRRAEGPVGVITNLDTGQPATNTDPCVVNMQRVFAYNPDAERALHEAILEFAAPFNPPGP